MSLRNSFIRVQIATAIVVAFSTWQARPENPVRPADVDVKDPGLRQTPNLSPNKNLLFNGWGVTPAGDAVNISDMPLKMVIAPDNNVLLAVSAGFNDTGLSLLDLHTKTVKQFIPLPEVWNGLAFSHDGRRIFVSGATPAKSMSSTTKMKRPRRRKH